MKKIKVCGRCKSSNVRDYCVDCGGLTSAIKIKRPLPLNFYWAVKKGDTQGTPVMICEFIKGRVKIFGSALDDDLENYCIVSESIPFIQKGYRLVSEAL